MSCLFMVRGVFETPTDAGTPGFRKPTPVGSFDGLFENLHADIAEPDVVAVILESDVTLMVLAAAVVQQLEGQRPLSEENLLFSSISVHWGVQRWYSRTLVSFCPCTTVPL